MKFHYDKESDSLYIELQEHPGTDSREVSEGIVLDFDTAGKLVGIDIQHASLVANLTTLQAISLPVESISVSSSS